MNNLTKTILVTSVFMLITACKSSDNDDKQTSQPSIQPIPFEPLEATISDLHASLESKGSNCVNVVQSYLDRITAYDKQGPTLNSVISINPNILQEANELDEYYKKTGKFKGSLHCVPVLAKDNIDVINIANTAGSDALLDNIPQDDAYIIKNIKAQGGLIIGKANLDEFAFGFGGKSTVGGQAKNVYDLTKGPGGSSSGTGTAISASLAMVGIGTDTGGSIRVPSAVQGLVGLRPSLRVLSLDGIIPLAPTQDTAGPMCRQSIDCAKLFTAMVGYDPSSSSNQRNSFEHDAPLVNSETAYRTLINQQENYVPQNASLVGKHIGLIKNVYANSEEGLLVQETIAKAAEKMREAGAIVEEVEIYDLPTILGSADITTDSGYTGRFASLSRFEFKESLTNYLLTATTSYKSYTDLLNSGKMISNFKNYDTDPNTSDFINGYHLNTTVRAPFVRLRLNSALDNTRLDGMSKGQRFDALAYPSITGLTNNIPSSPTTGSNNRISPFSGFPALSIPAGAVNYEKRSAYPMNVNIEFIAREFDEPTLFEIAAAFEKINPSRMVPIHTPALKAAL
ncbi:amidase family protein [Acinetobacter pittii]|nr:MULTISPECIES: amidase family protein [Acinetobacter]MCM5531235.1 amidase family protein [Acinetobacter pittii]MCQ9383549.1 amidase family protein [Acinetobacter pittii]MCR3926270.1 amidase family protein [Acinetobacter pittii]